MTQVHRPIKREESDTVEETLTDNALNNILPARYLLKDENGAVVEEPSELFERVAKNVALAEAAYLDQEIRVTPEQVKERHTDRESIIDDIFGMRNTAILTEENVKHFSYDSIVPDLPPSAQETVVHHKGLFQDQMESLGFMPNSPTLMNAGTELQQLSACFVNSPTDDIDDIHQKVKEAAKTFKSGGGMGYAFHHLRPYGDQVGSTGGIASGPISFMHTFDQMCGTIAQGGKRRGAQMGVMRVSHPDIPYFIHAKNKDVSLAKTLLLNDPDDYTHTEFSDALEEARGLITEDGRVPKHLRNAAEGHLSNFNISVGMTDEFMDTVRANEEYTFINPRTSDPHIATEHTKELWGWFDLGEHVEVGEPLRAPARALWDRMIEGAHENGEPGMIFIDRVNEDHSYPVESNPTVDPENENSEYEVHGTNPCWTSEAEVWTTQGPVSFGELAEDGQDVEVLTQTDDGKLTTEIMRSPGMTGERETVEIQLTDGSVLQCTENHALYRYDGEEVNAGDLKPGDSLAGVYRHNANSKGYKRLSNGVESPLEHHVMVESSEGRRPDYPNEHCHHIDGDETNNRPENLEIVDASEHNSSHMKGENNPMSDVWDESNPLYDVDTGGKNNGRYRDDISTEEVRKLMEEGLSYKEIANKVGCSKYTVQKRLGYERPGNHTVSSVTYTGETEPVYNGTVENTHRYFVMCGSEDAILSKNCGEQPLLEGEACNLGHINLSTVVDRDTPDWRDWDGSVESFLDEAVDWKILQKRVKVGTRFLENVVTMSDFPIQKMEETVANNRKIGLGIMGLAQMFVQMGVMYGSDAGDEIARLVMEQINHESKSVSHELAKQRGSFSNWVDSKYADPASHPNWFRKQTGKNPTNWEGGFAMRNHNTTTIAPTGSTSMVGNTTGGCEPIYNVAYYKNVSGDVQGDEMLVEFDDYFLRTLEANDIDVEAVKAEAEQQMSVNEYDGVDGLSSVPNEIGELFVTTDQLSALDHAGIQIACQKGVDSAISKTINAPADASIEDTEEAFLYLHEHGAKGVTYYRDGTRAKQVVTTRADNSEFAEDDS